MLIKRDGAIIYTRGVRRRHFADTVAGYDRSAQDCRWECRRHASAIFVTCVCRFFKAVDNFIIYCKHRQMMKMSCNEPTCFYIRYVLHTYLYKKNLTPAKFNQLRTGAVYQLINSWSAGMLKFVATVSSKSSPLPYVIIGLILILPYHEG